MKATLKMDYTHAAEPSHGQTEMLMKETLRMDFQWLRKNNLSWQAKMVLYWTIWEWQKKMETELWNGPMVTSTKENGSMIYWMAMEYFNGLMATVFLVTSTVVVT